MLKRFKSNLTRTGQIFLLVLIGLAVFFLVTQLSGGVPTAHALPEYTDRTGESCGTCHVNPGGGGPRTLSGLLWAANGRPDAVPVLPGVLAAPAEITDGLELYDIACAGCHGLRGEGLFAINIAGSGISKAAIESFILDGITGLGMPGFRDQFTQTQLENLVEFSAQLSAGEIILPDSYELPPPLFTCVPVNDQLSCGVK
jgi:mono/diheme cytochrome c family protein